LVSDFSTGDYDGITLTTSTEGGQSVLVEIWGIPVDGSTGMDRVVGAAHPQNAVTHAFVHVFRGAMPNIRVVQEADGRVPMIVEYDALDGSSVREFIQGSLVNSGRCSYIAVTRIVAVDDLPSGYQVTEMLIEVRFDEED
jgi:hypothetical protein